MSGDIVDRLGFGCHICVSDANDRVEFRQCTISNKYIVSLLEKVKNKVFVFFMDEFEC